MKVIVLGILSALLVYNISFNQNVKESSLETGSLKKEISIEEGRAFNKQLEALKDHDDFEIIKYFPFFSQDDLEIYKKTLKLCENEETKTAISNYGSLFLDHLLSSFTEQSDLENELYLKLEGKKMINRYFLNWGLSNDLTSTLASPGFDEAIRECFPDSSQFKTCRFTLKTSHASGPQTELKNPL